MYFLLILLSVLNLRPDFSSCFLPKRIFVTVFSNQAFLLVCCFLSPDTKREI